LSTLVLRQGREFLAIWAETSSPERRIDRAGRPLVANALLGPLAPHEVSDKLKEQYNEATPSTSAQFIPEIQKSLGLYDGYDGKWGNQFLADRDADLTDTATEPSLRYRRWPHCFGRSPLQMAQLRFVTSSLQSSDATSWASGIEQ
jgi:hypothetical protein